jgi:hypothetical protein
MITIFTIPKAFKGHIGVTQRNAVRSWTLLGPDVEVFLCGDDEGTEEVARSYGTGFIGDIARSEFGTPLLSSAFDRVLSVAKHDVLCYVNADIIFMQDFAAAVRRTRLKRFLMVGERWDLDVDFGIDFDSPSWETELRADAMSRGAWHGPFGSDYFVFRRDPALCALPPFAVGRAGWDCWFIYHARRIGIPVINATRAVMPIHQNHDYSHVPQKHGESYDGKVWTGPETARHRALIGAPEHYFTPLDATHLLTDRGVALALDREHLLNRWYRWPVLNPAVAPWLSLLDKATPRALKRIVSSLLPQTKEPG